MSLVLYDSSDSGESESEGEREVKVGSECRDIKKLLPALPAPSGRGKRPTGPVRICLPSLAKKNLDDDSDEDDDDNVPRAKRKPTGGLGLTALLPQPKQTASKLISKTAPSSTPLSRGLVPYTLSKHGQAAAARRDHRKRLTQHGKGPQRLPASQDESGSDKEEEEEEEGVMVSFFPHLDTSHLPKPIDPSGSCSPSDSSEGGGGAVWVGLGRESVEVAPSAPRPFILETDDGRMEGETGYDLIDDGEGSVDQPHPPHPYPVALQGADPGLAMDDHAYRRLTGGRRRKQGLDTALNDIIDVKEEDVKVGGMETYRKNLAEEAVEKLYQAPGANTPTSQQKRKHQLSFLAHHAKENELKLMKQWAQSAATRRDTQMKYGF